MHLVSTCETSTATLVGEPWQVGDRIGQHYVIRKLLGRGGMSAVWEADDLRLRRKVALKVMVDLSEPSDLITHEARALAAVRHPGLPIPFELGTHGGLTFLALERLYGVTLEDRVLYPDRGDAAFELNEVTHILSGVADVLAAVHAAGMAHHDVKPGNIMLCGRGRVVLLDFGIMVPEVDAGHATPSGTPSYLAPEAFIGNVRRGQAHLLDIYAFGAMAFQMLTGRVPFAATDLVELYEQHATQPVPDLLALRRGLPRALADLVRACMAKAPSDRPADVEEIAWQLRRIRRDARDGETARSRRRSTTGPIVERRRRDGAETDD